MTRPNGSHPLPEFPSRICTIVPGAARRASERRVSGRVERVEAGRPARRRTTSTSVAAGVEDYYVGGEAPGRWIASSDRLLGLDGIVRPDALHRVLSGRDPSTGTRLGQAHRVPGYDLTFRAPKSVSVLFGLGDPDTARAVRDAHDRAVRVGARVRRTARRVVTPRPRRRRADPRRGADRGGVPASHEPQRRPASAHPRPRPQHGARHRRQMGDVGWPVDLHRRPRRSATSTKPSCATTSPTRWGCSGDRCSTASATSPASPTAVLRAFSTRRAEIEERMDIRGQHSPQAAMIAALDTRKAKGHDARPGAAARHLGGQGPRTRLRPRVAAPAPAPNDEPQRSTRDEQRAIEDGC